MTRHCPLLLGFVLHVARCSLLEADRELARTRTYLSRLTCPQFVVRRYYTPLIQRTPRHRLMLYAWFFFYIFVGIQMAWVLRPFVGDPNMPVTFFRREAWGNAYVVTANLVAHVIRRIAGL
ncbi:MAG: hypothetical protein FJ279_24165 [Planctomycetes bacterium]|nr:hypothetical protein [Planctomycetota bacterium]